MAGKTTFIFTLTRTSRSLNSCVYVWFLRVCVWVSHKSISSNKADSSKTLQERGKTYRTVCYQELSLSPHSVTGTDHSSEAAAPPMSSERSTAFMTTWSELCRPATYRRCENTTRPASCFRHGRPFRAHECSPRDGTTAASFADPGPNTLSWTVFSQRKAMTCFSNLVLHSSDPLSLSLHI